jgi:hypothetical protein
MPLPGPGVYQIRTAVQEDNSGQIGSAEAFIDVPDFNRPQLTLSSVLVSDRDPERTRKLESEGVIGGGSPVTRVFGPGVTLQYRCEVYGASPRPQIDMEVQLFRGPERIFKGTPIKIPVRSGVSHRIQAAGEVRLPGSLPPGVYAAEFIAHDRSKGAKAPSSTGWVDFRLSAGN